MMNVRVKCRRGLVLFLCVLMVAVVGVAVNSGVHTHAEAAVYRAGILASAQQETVEEECKRLTEN